MRLVVVLWNLGFIVKFSFIAAGKSIFELDQEENIDAYSACLFGACDFFSLVIPFYSVVNTKFVKIFSFKAFERKQELVQLEENSIIDVLTTQAYDNSRLIVNHQMIGSEPFQLADEENKEDGVSCIYNKFLD